MCLIVNFKPEFDISEDLMKHFAVRNNDGFGIMWIQDNRLCHEKYGPDKMEFLYPLYQNLKQYEGYIHLRMRTHGATNQEMAHPFNCGFGIYLMHNGVLDSKGDDTSKSDTWHFVNNIVSPLFRMSKNPHKLIRSAAFSDLVHKYIGFSNRIVIGDRGGFIRFNESSWHKVSNEYTGVKGMLVSNQYAWSADGYGKPVPEKKLPNYYGHRYTYNMYSSDNDEDEHENLVWGFHDPRKRKANTHLFPTITGESLDKALESHFFHLRSCWYGDSQARIYKRRPDSGLDRRSDLDEDNQFWNSMEQQVMENYSNWLFVKNNNTHPSSWKHPKKEDKPVPNSSQLNLNLGEKH